MSALGFWAFLANKHVPAGLQGWPKVIGGLICFAAGRWVRMGLRYDKAIDDFDKRFRAILAAHGLSDEDPFSEYLARSTSRGSWRLYVRLWAEARQSDKLTPSLSFLKRYWVMAATYDGVAIALTVWVAVLFAWCAGIGVGKRLELKVGIPVIAALLLMSYACLRAAGRFVRYQVEELVATIAVQRSNAK